MSQTLEIKAASSSARYVGINRPFFSSDHIPTSQLNSPIRKAHMDRHTSPLPTKTTRLGLGTQDLLQVHNLQARVRRSHDEAKPETGLVSSPLTGMPYLVPILRWIE